METIRMRSTEKARLARTHFADARGGMHLASWSANVSARSEARLAAESVAPVTRIAINSNKDIAEARQTGSLLVQSMGFSGSRITLVTTVISELARNILLYARTGEIVLSRPDDRAQINVQAFDRGPGIENLPVVLSGGYSTSGGLGLGLSGLRRIANEFEIKTQPGRGTQVFVCIHA